MRRGSTTTGRSVAAGSEGDHTLRIDPDSTDWRLVEGEILGLDRRTDEYFAIKGSGALLWRMLADSATDEELVGLLSERYGLPLERARNDVAAFVTMLRSRGFLTA